MENNVNITSQEVKSSSVVNCVNSQETTTDIENDNNDADELDSSYEIFVSKKSSNLNVKKETKSIFKIDCGDKNIAPGESDLVSSQDMSNINYLVTLNKCPICLKVFEKLNIVHHVKSCALKKKLTPKQIFNAVKLQKKQDKEREDCGLPIVPEKPAPRKPGKRKVPTTGADPNIDLALALSKSLKDSEERALIKEADILVEAGLNEEAENALKTLENYGFASTSQPHILCNGL